MNKFSERLQELRIEKNLSQSQLAKELNNELTNSAISLWELGKRTPNLDALIILNVSIDYIAGLKDER